MCTGICAIDGVSGCRFTAPNGWVRCKEANGVRRGRGIQYSAVEIAGVTRVQGEAVVWWGVSRRVPFSRGVLHMKKYLYLQGVSAVGFRYPFR